jgi:hypothetical protein
MRGNSRKQAARVSQAKQAGACVGKGRERGMEWEGEVVGWHNT